MDVRSIINEVCLAIDEEDVNLGSHLPTDMSRRVENVVRVAARHAL